MLNKHLLLSVTMATGTRLQDLMCLTRRTSQRGGTGPFRTRHTCVATRTWARTLPTVQHRAHSPPCAHLPYTEMAPRMTHADHSGRYLMNTKAMRALIMMR